MIQTGNLPNQLLRCQSFLFSRDRPFPIITSCHHAALQKKKLNIEKQRDKTKREHRKPWNSPFFEPFFNGHKT